MDTHEITLTPVADKDGATRYELTVITGQRPRIACTRIGYTARLRQPLTPSIRRFQRGCAVIIVEGIRGEGKPVVFCLEDSFQEQ